MRPALLLVIAASLGACDRPPPEPAPGCNPLVGDDCLTPFPSAFFEQPDPSSPTGVRVNLGTARLPAGTAERLERQDGYSPATAFVVYLRDGVDPAQLPPLADPASSLLPDASVQILDEEDGTRVPLFAEVDAAVAPPQHQALLIRPLVRLRPRRRYLIALVGLRDREGHALAPAPFVALRDGGPVNQALRPLVDRYEAIFARLAAAGLARGRLTLAWDVDIGSDPATRLVRLRDEALAQVDQLSWQIDRVEDRPTGPVAREVVGRFDVPSFLESDAPGAGLALDERGEPRLRGTSSAPFVAHIPACARGRAAPLPVVLVGHGVFGDGKNEIDRDYQQAVSERACVVELATDWVGLSTSDVGPIGNAIAADPARFTLITDRLHQGHVNFQVLTRLFLRRMRADPAFVLDGSPVSDGSQAYYWGISNGAIQGGTFLALSPDVARGVLTAGGGVWSLLLLRSYDFNLIKTLFDTVLPDRLDQLLLLTMSQSEWDHVDPASFAPHLLADPLPGARPKQVLLQEAVDDSDVPNLGTRVLARLVGLSGLDLVQPVFGVPEATAPLASAYTQWDVHAVPRPPEGAVPADTPNAAHECIRHLEPLQAQVAGFLRPDGQVTSVCGGPCSFPLSVCEGL